ncbi:hypothetical protein YPPY58_1754, partial [Yersinia pestis PY-58]
MKVILGYGFGL